MSAALKSPVDETVSRATGGALRPSERHSFPEPTEFPCEFGGYALLGLLGRGGMGAVYEAEQHATGRRIVLKMLGHQLDSPDMRLRFLREGRLAASVSHPNSLYVFGTEQIEGRPVITMEIARGDTGSRCFYPWRLRNSCCTRPTASLLSRLLCWSFYGSAPRSMPLFIPTAVCMTGWLAPG